MASNPIQMIEQDSFSSLDYGYPYRLKVAILHNDLRLSAEKSALA
jgi:hypothetical protein